MVTDLVDHDVGDDGAQALVILRPVVEDRPAVEMDGVGHLAGLRAETLLRQADAAEQAEQVEAGIKYQPANVNALVTLAAYEITQNNVLVVDPDHTLYSIQQGEVRSRGVELEGRWNIARNFSVHGAYAYIDSEVTRTTDAATLGREIPLQPKHTASLGGDYTFTAGALAGLGFGLDVRYVGAHYGDSANLWRTPSYTLFDAAVHYDLGNWRLQLNAQNLADKEYVSTCDSAFWCYYGYPRSITASARYQW